MNAAARSAAVPASPARRRATLALLGAGALAAFVAAGLATGRIEGMAATLPDLRLGRASAAFVTGAALALAGVMMQALVRNPLADPYMLGVSAGSAVGVLAALLSGAALWAVDLGAFGGALAPQQLPEGELTSLIGVPVFLFQPHHLQLRHPGLS